MMVYSYQATSIDTKLVLPFVCMLYINSIASLYNLWLSFVLSGAYEQPKAVNTSIASRVPSQSKSIYLPCIRKVISCLLIRLFVGLCNIVVEKSQQEVERESKMGMVTSRLT